MVGWHVVVHYYTKNVQHINTGAKNIDSPAGKESQTPNPFVTISSQIAVKAGISEVTHMSSHGDSYGSYAIYFNGKLIFSV